MWSLIVLTAVVGHAPLAKVMEVYPTERACVKYLAMAEDAVAEVKRMSPETHQTVACLPPPDAETVRRSLDNFKGDRSRLQGLL